MKIHIIQKIGLTGIAFICLVAVVLVIGGAFSPFVFIATFPFFALLIVGYYMQSKKRRHQH